MTRQPGETIKLSQFLKWKGLCASGGEAKICIIEGEVEVNGEVETRRGRVLRNGDRVNFEGQQYIVSVGEER